MKPERALLLVLLSCTPFRPGQGVTPDFATAWGCDAGDIATRASALDSALEAGHVYIPQVGWTACDVLAHNGTPTRVDLQQTAYGRSASWWYECPDCDQPTVHLLSLNYDPDRVAWVVTYVGW